MSTSIQREVTLITLRYVLLVLFWYVISCVAIIYQNETLDYFKNQYGSYHIQRPMGYERDYQITCDEKIQRKKKQGNDISLSCYSKDPFQNQAEHYPWDKEPQATHIPIIEVIDSKIARVKVMKNGVYNQSVTIHIS
ncbi:MAG: hypothetical protein ACRCVE_04960 [Plesiomonas sp.]